MFVTTPEVLPSVTMPDGVTRNPFAMVPVGRAVPTNGGNPVIQILPPEKPNGGCGCKSGAAQSGPSLLTTVVISALVSAAVFMLMREID